MKKKFTLLIAALLTSLGFSATAAVGDEFVTSSIRYRVVADEGDIHEVEFAAPQSSFYTITANSFSETVSDGTTTYTIVGIGEGAFRNAQFPSTQGTFNFPRTIRYIADYAFEGAKGGNSGGGSDRGMRNVRIYDDNLQTISKTAFINNRLIGSFYIGNSIEGGFCNWANDCKQGSRETTMSSVCYETTLLGMGNQCNHANSSGAIITKTITMNSSIKVVGENAMYGNSIFTTINLNAVEEVESHAFKNCVFQTVTIPATCTTIAADAFEGCTAISNLTCNAATPPAGAVFDDAVYARIRESGNITVPADALEAYQADPNWYKFWSETPPAPPVTRVHFAEAENGEVTADNLNPDDGATVTLTVNPAAGYKLENINAEAVIDPGNAQAPHRIAGPGVGINVELTTVVEGQTYTFVMPDAPYEVLVTPEFAQAEYTITVSDGIENGTVAADKETAFYGETVTVTATPAEGYELETLTYTVEGAEPVAIENGAFAMPAGNVTINATFKATDFTITVADAENGTVEAPATAHFGDNVTVTATPAEGYELATLTYTVEGAEPVAIENGTFTMPAANVTINATFTAIDYTITVAETENGTVTAPATANFDQTVTLTVTPAEGYELTELTYTVEGAEPVAIENGAFTMPAANVTINATFTAIDYTITVAETAHGTVEADKATANFGETVTVTATPAAGYELTELTYTAEGAEPVAIENGAFSMPAANVTINATFTAIGYTITVAETENGTVTADKEAANYGETVTLTVTPDEGYELAELTYTAEGAEPVAIENGTFSMPAADVTINATFTATDYTITVAETENGTVTAPATANFGQTVNVTVTPAEGYELTELTYTAEGAEPVAIENGTFTMPAANVTINATFNLIPVVLDGVVFANNTYATWYGNQNLAVPENVTAYVVTGIENDVTIIEEVNYLPAGVGVLLYSTTPADVVTTVPYTGETAEVASMLQGYLEDTAIADGYVLYNDGFVLTLNGTLAAHRCYLPKAQAPAGAPRYLRIIQNGGVVTAIDDVRVTSDGSVKYVNPMGQVSDRPFQGVNIVVDGNKTYKVIKN